MARLNPEFLQQLAIKAVQDLAESSHYLYASIKAVDFGAPSVFMTTPGSE